MLVKQENMIRGIKMPPEKTTLETFIQLFDKRLESIELQMKQLVENQKTLVLIEERQTEDRKTMSRVWNQLDKQDERIGALEKFDIGSSIKQKASDRVWWFLMAGGMSVITGLVVKFA